MAKEGYDALYAQKAEEEDQRRYQSDTTDAIRTAEPVTADKYVTYIFTFN